MKLLGKYRALLVDMDGVLWRGRQVLLENIEGLKELGLPMVFLTNRSTTSRALFANKIKKLGLEVKIENIITSAYATAKWLREKGFARAFVVGESGLLEELLNEGIEAISEPDFVLSKGFKPDVLVVGMDREFNYQKLWAALRVIEKGAIFVATNTDKTFPLEDGFAPGAGAIVASIEAAAGKSPHVVVGKPNKAIYRYALKVLEVEKPEEVLAIGDRWETDVVGAKRNQMDILIVLTGVIGEKEGLERKKEPGVFVAKSIKNWVQEVKNA